MERKGKERHGWENVRWWPVGRREAGERGIVENRGVGNRGNDRTKGFFCEVKRNCPSEREQFELNRLRYYKRAREEQRKEWNGMERQEGRRFYRRKNFQPLRVLQVHTYY